MGKWKREPKRKEKASVRRNRPSQRARTKAHTQVDPRRHKRQAEETHTTRDDSRSVHHKQPEGCSYTNIHVLTCPEVVNKSRTGGTTTLWRLEVSWGRDAAARLERDNDKSTVGHTRPRTTWGECAMNSRRDCNVAIRKARNHVTDVCTISLFHNVLT